MTCVVPDEPSTSLDAEERETSSATTKLILAYVRSLLGDEAVDRVLQQAELPHPRALLESDSHWVSYQTRIRLMTAAVDVLGDDEAMFKVGGSAIRSSVAPSLVLLLRALGTPAQVYRKLPRALGKFSTTSTLEMVEVTRDSAVIRFKLHEGYAHSRLDCSYAQGLFSVVPEIFGLPPAHILHDECESDGFDACIYHVTWARRSRLLRRRVAADRAYALNNVELTSLRAQLEALQSASAELVHGDDLDAALVRIMAGAASAVLAHGYLLAVRNPDGSTRVHAAGVEPERQQTLAADLLDGRDLGQPAVVVDVASSRTWHGRLAVLYPHGQSGVPNEGSMLRAYAGHAAAALDMIQALDAARRGQRRGDVLLELSRRLAAASDMHQVAAIVTAALPEITDCSMGAVLLWHADTGRLRYADMAGVDGVVREALLDVELSPLDVPELAQMLTALQPVRLKIDEVGVVLRELLSSAGVSHVICVPLLAGGELLGVVAASWPQEAPPPVGEGDLTLRLIGVADQAATALQNARLVSEVRHQALHDSLTGLPNRVLFTDRLAEALRSRSTQRIGVLFCDLDRFKQVNDARGHAVGDELLRQAAARIVSAVRDCDTVGRISGDEFAVFLPHLATPEQAVIVARRITAAFDRPFRVEGEDLRVTTSVGVAVHSGSNGRVDQLLRAADAAMYDAKQRGLNQVSATPSGSRPRPASGGGAAPVVSLERELQEALERDELRLFYQPIVDVPSGSTVGSEALVRWQHPRLGLLSPATFLPVAEETQLIVDVDAWVLRTACAEAALRPIASQRVAVNLSGRTLSDPQLVSRVRAALQASRLPAECLEVEIVESRALLDVAAVQERLQALRLLGVRVALDDFGTGYSTLTWLQMLPVDQVKIDRSFTSRIACDAGTAALIRGVLALTHELGLDVVAEGVEKREQLEALHAAGVRRMQGYLLGRPAAEWPLTSQMPIEERTTPLPGQRNPEQRSRLTR